MAIYKRLFFDNIESFCARTFKSFRAIVDDDQWHALVRSFIKHHRSETPYFREIPSEFLQFLSDRGELGERYPYIVEMCHFDLVRGDLYFAPNSIAKSGRLTDAETRIQLSPLVRLLSYQWPVHQINETFDVSKTPSGTTWLIAFLNRRGRVEYLETNPRTVRMLELLQHSRSCRELLQELAEELETKFDSINEQGFEMLKTFVRSGVVVLAEEPRSQKDTIP